jgi:hypothetical protein
LTGSRSRSEEFGSPDGNDDDASIKIEVATEEELSEEERFLLGLTEEQLAEMYEGSSSAGPTSVDSMRVRESLSIDLGSSPVFQEVGSLPQRPQSSFAARRARALAATEETPPTGYSFVSDTRDEKNQVTGAKDANTVADDLVG